MEFMRGIAYPLFSNIFGNVELQREGLISVIDLRGRHQVSSMEAMHNAGILLPMLETFGIDIGADWMEGDVEGSPFSSESIMAASLEYLRIDAIWKRIEAPYCDPTSNIALYPNTQDILMGKIEMSHPFGLEILRLLPSSSSMPRDMAPPAQTMKKRSCP